MTVIVWTKNIGKHSFPDAQYEIIPDTGNLLVTNVAGRFRFAKAEWRLVTEEEVAS